MEARVQGCVTCHGQSGQGTNNGYFPRIAGKPAGYLYNQLVAFRDGTRSYPPMNYLVAYLPDAYLREMARALREAAPAVRAAGSRRAVAARLIERGKTLVDAGDAAKQIPAVRRLPRHGTHRHGARHSRPRRPAPDLHRRPAHALARRRAPRRRARLHEAHRHAPVRTDVAAVAAYLATQEPPSDPSPESANLVRMPIACGSQR